MDKNSNGGRKYSTHTIRSILGLKDDTATTDSLHNDDKSTSINTSIKTNGVITPTINVPDLTKDRLNDQSIDQLKIRLVETRGIPYPKYVTDTLKNWFTKNMAHPYPTDAEKIHLSNITKLRLSQINNWFNNTRRKHRKQIDELRAIG